jgi:hypothetical protein
MLETLTLAGGLFRAFAFWSFVLADVPATAGSDLEFTLAV